MPSPTSVIVDGVPAGHSIEVPGRDGRGLRRVAVVLAVLAGALLVGAVVIGASAWNFPQATLFRSQWWSLLAAVPAPAATCATLGIVVALVSLCCRLLQRLRRHGWPADAAVLILVAGLAVVGSAAVAAAAVGATGAAEVGNSYLRATAAVAHTRAGVIATTDARGGQAPSVFEARMSPEARTALAIDYETRRPGARTVSLHLVGATATVAGPWIEETVRIDDRWSIGEEDASEHTCLIDPFNGRIEAVWWHGL